LPESAGIIVVGHVGRLAEVGGGMGEPELAAVSGPASKLCRNTTFWFGVGQSRTQLTLTGALMGLPNVNEAVAMFAPMIREHHPEVAAVADLEIDDAVSIPVPTDEYDDSNGAK